MFTSQLDDFAFPLPALEEQGEIIEAIEGQLSIIDHLETDIEAKLENAKGLRQSILRNAFAGKLVPQNPNDEPASELLKRVAAEREQRSRDVAAGKKLKGHKARQASKAGARGKAGHVATKETDNGRIADR